MFLIFHFEGHPRLLLADLNRGCYHPANPQIYRKIYDQEQNPHWLPVGLKFVPSPAHKPKKEAAD